MPTDPTADANRSAENNIPRAANSLADLLASPELQEVIAMTATRRVERATHEGMPSNAAARGPAVTSPLPASGEGAASTEGAPAATAVAVTEVVHVVGEIDATGPGLWPLVAFRSREAAERWAAAWVRGEVADGRLAVGHDTTEIRTVPLDPAAVPVVRERQPARAHVDVQPLRTDRPDLLDEDALPLDGLTEAQRTDVLERLARDAFGEHAPEWWGTATPDTWDVAPRALLSSDVGARQVRKVLLSIWRGILGIYV